MSKFIGIIERSQATIEMEKASHIYANCEKSKYYFYIKGYYETQHYIPCFKQLREMYNKENINIDFIRRLSTYIKLYLGFHDNMFPTHYSVLYSSDSKGFKLLGKLFEPSYKLGDKITPGVIGTAYIENIYDSDMTSKFLRYGYFNVETPKTENKKIREELRNTFLELPIKEQGIYAQMYFEVVPDIKIFVNIAELLTKEEQEIVKASCANNFENIKFILSFNEYTGAKIERIIIKE